MLHKNRLHKLQLALKEIDAILVNDSINLYYLTGLELSSGKLLVHHHGSYLLVDNRYFEICQKKSPFPVLLSEKNPLHELLARPELAYIRKLGFDSEKTSYAAYMDLQKHLKERIELVAVESPLKKIRAVKDREEIDILRQACELGSEGFDYVCSLLNEGVTEIEIASELEIFWKRRGGKGLAFEPIIAFGPNGSMPHYRAGTSKLEKGQSVLIDIGVNYQHYHSDMTRVVFFGNVNPEIKKIYAIVDRAKQLALSLCRSGTLIRDLDDAARNYIASQGYGENFMHSLGHGVGLEIHEFPLIRNSPLYQAISLEAGMVITIEPGIYLPGIGGVRLEDTIVITEKGYENLTLSGCAVR